MEVLARSPYIQKTDGYCRPPCQYRKYYLVGWESDVARFYIPCSFLPMYKMNQDHLELYFGAVRAAGGHNNNPTCWQFKATNRKLMSRCDVATGDRGNVQCLDDTDILDVNQERRGESSPARVMVGDLTHLDDHAYSVGFGELSVFLENVVTCISGFVARKLLGKLVCDKCKLALVAHDPSETLFTPLVNIKTRGGFIYPSESLRQVVGMCEKMLRSAVNLANVRKYKGNWGLKLEISVMERFISKQDVFPELLEHYVWQHGWCRKPLVIPAKKNCEGVPHYQAIFRSKEVHKRRQKGRAYVERWQRPSSSRTSEHWLVGMADAPEAHWILSFSCLHVILFRQLVSDVCRGCIGCCSCEAVAYVSLSSVKHRNKGESVES